MPSARLTTRLMKPRGFFRPDNSVSSAWSVPMPPPPPPPFMPAPMICLFLLVRGSAGSTANCEVSTSRAIRIWLSSDR